MGRRATDKRERLVRAAAGRFHRDGLQSASLAEIARDADVAAGNVFYYFRSKEELARAVADDWLARIDAYFAALCPDGSPAERIEAFLDGAVERRQGYADLGCPLVGLARDFRQAGGALAALAPRVNARQIEWIAAQYEAMGEAPASAHERARFLLAALQGSFHLAHALGAPEQVAATVARLKAG